MGSVTAHAPVTGRIRREGEVVQKSPEVIEMSVSLVISLAVCGVPFKVVMQSPPVTPNRLARQKEGADSLNELIGARSGKETARDKGWERRERGQRVGQPHHVSLRRRTRISLQRAVRRRRCSALRVTPSLAVSSCVRVRLFIARPPLLAVSRLTLGEL